MRRIAEFIALALTAYGLFFPTFWLSFLPRYGAPKGFAAALTLFVRYRASKRLTELLRPPANVGWLWSLTLQSFVVDPCMAHDRPLLDSAGAAVYLDRCVFFFEASGNYTLLSEPRADYHADALMVGAVGLDPPPNIRLMPPYSIEVDSDWDVDTEVSGSPKTPPVAF